MYQADQETRKLQKQIIEGSRRSTVKSGYIQPIEEQTDLGGYDYILPIVSAASIDPIKATFLLPGVPDDNITLLVGDGGVGKGFIACHIAAAISNGERCLLDPVGIAVRRDPGKVILISAEDDFARQVRKRLDGAGANLNNIYTVDFSDSKIWKNLKLDSPALLKTIKLHKPRLLIIDPIQSFLKSDQDMNSRNDMRNALAPLQITASKCKCAVMIVIHTNKQTKASGRTRLSGSADLWDIARSVFIIGHTNEEDKARYLSHEKSNYGLMLKTKLFGIDDLGVYYIGETERKDYDFIRDRDKMPGGRPPAKRGDCKQIILDTLADNGGVLNGDELAAVIEANGISEPTYKRARSELLQLHHIVKTETGFGRDKIITYRLRM